MGNQLQHPRKNATSFRFFRKSMTTNTMNPLMMIMKKNKNTPQENNPSLRASRESQKTIKQLLKDGSFQSCEKMICCTFLLVRVQQTKNLLVSIWYITNRWGVVVWFAVIITAFYCLFVCLQFSGCHYPFSADVFNDNEVFIFSWHFFIVLSLNILYECDFNQLNHTHSIRVHVHMLEY